MVARSYPTLARIAAIGALLTALGLAGCGRKSGLDAPPSLAAAPGPSEAPAAGPALGPDGKPIAPATGPKKPFPLDLLVD